MGKGDNVALFTKLTALLERSNLQYWSRIAMGSPTGQKNPPKPIARYDAQQTTVEDNPGTRFRLGQNFADKKTFESQAPMTKARLNPQSSAIPQARDIANEEPPKSRIELGQFCQPRVQGSVKVLPKKARWWI
jgi:hypothetical protein